MTFFQQMFAFCLFVRKRCRPHACIKQMHSPIMRCTTCPRRLAAGGEQGIRQILLCKILSLGDRISLKFSTRLALFAKNSSLNCFFTLRPSRVRICFIQSKTKSSHLKGNCFSFWRRARDSNPRNRFSSLHDFQSH